MKLLPSILPLSVSLCLIATAAAPPEVSNTDARVIRTALEAFYSKSDWAADWKRGDFVVVDAKSDFKRPKFREALGIVLGKISLEGRDRVLLEKINRAQPAHQAYSPEPRLVLQSLDLGPKVVVTAEKIDLNRWKRNPHWVTDKDGKKVYVAALKLDPQMVTNRSGKKGTVRVYCSISAPAYSADGRFAILNLTAPWFMHAVEIAFVLEMKNRSWRVVHVETTYDL